MSMSMEGVRTSAGKFLGPAKSLSEVFINTAEKMVEMQFQSGKVYWDVALVQWRKIPQIRNVEDLGDFMWGQIEPVSEINKQLLNDWKTLVTLNTEFSDGIKHAFTTDKQEPVSETASETPEPQSESITRISRAGTASSRSRKKGATKQEISHVEQQQADGPTRDADL